jgi:hypothetical protein
MSDPDPDPPVSPHPLEYAEAPPRVRPARVLAIVAAIVLGLGSVLFGVLGSVWLLGALFGGLNTPASVWATAVVTWGIAAGLFYAAVSMSDVARPKKRRSRGR